MLLPKVLSNAQNNRLLLTQRLFKNIRFAKVTLEER